MTSPLLQASPFAAPRAVSEVPTESTAAEAGIVARPPEDFSLEQGLPGRATGVQGGGKGEIAAAVEPLRFGSHERQFVLLRAARFVRKGELDPSDLADQLSRPDPEITAVIPARNEAATVAAVVEECRCYAANVIVVEGGSSDGTAETAEMAGAQLVRDQGTGKGAALRLAVSRVTTPICVFIDADGSHDPIDIPMLAAPIKAGIAEHVTGSRLLGGSDELHGGGDEFLRLAGSAFITYLINRRFHTRLSDSQNGFRAIRTDVFRRLDLRARHTTIEMEMIMATLAAGFRMAEVPTHERPRAAGYSKIALSSPGTWIAYGWTLLTGLCRRRAGKAPSPIV